MIDRLRLFLGPARLRALFLLIAITGLASLILNAFGGDNENVRAFQLILAAVAVLGATAIVLGRMQPQERGRWLLILAPAYGLLVLGILVLPQFGLAFFGFAVFWGLSARPTPDGAVVTPQMVAWSAGLAGVGFVAVAVSRLLQRMGRAAARD